MFDKKIIKKAADKTYKNFKIALPIMAGILMFIGLVNPPLKKYYISIFTGNYIFDPLIGAMAGSASFGIPITSYIAGGELLGSGVSLLAVTAFILTWTTVGIVMLPLEISALGRRFAIARNFTNFFFSIIIAILTIITINLI